MERQAITADNDGHT